MADSLQIRGGNRAGMPTLRARELAYCKDEKALYVGTGSENVKLCAAGEAEILARRTEALENAMPGKLTASAAAAQSVLADSADLAAVISAHNDLIEALKASGLMQA